MVTVGDEVFAFAVPPKTIGMTSTTARAAFTARGARAGRGRGGGGDGPAPGHPAGGGARGRRLVAGRRRDLRPRGACKPDRNGWRRLRLRTGAALPPARQRGDDDPPRGQADSA